MIEIASWHTCRAHLSVWRQRSRTFTGVPRCSFWVAGVAFRLFWGCVWRQRSRSRVFAGAHFAWQAWRLTSLFRDRLFWQFVWRQLISSPLCFFRFFRLPGRQHGCHRGKYGQTGKPRKNHTWFFRFCLLPCLPQGVT